VGQHVVHLAGQVLALGEGGRLHLGGPGLLELPQQADGEGGQGQQHAQPVAVQPRRGLLGGAVDDHRGDDHHPHRP
jgi:hypothetical protein